MSYLVSASALAVLLFVACAVAPVFAIPGGVGEASVKDTQVIKAAEFAVKAHKAEMDAKGDKKDLTLVKIVGAKQQVVQGMNYQLTLEVKEGDATRTATAEVWVRAWLKAPEDYQLTKWEYQKDK